MISLKDSDNNLFCFSQEVFDDLRATRTRQLGEQGIRTILGFFAANQRYLKLLHSWSKVMGQEEANLAILDAHGYTDLPSWQYEDEGGEVPVQSWIDEHDGKFTALAIYACNSDNHEISSKRSLVFHPNSVVSVFDVIQRRGVARAYVPNIGYIGSKARDIDRVIKGLPIV